MYDVSNRRVVDTETERCIRCAETKDSACPSRNEVRGLGLPDNLDLLFSPQIMYLELLCVVNVSMICRNNEKR